MEFLGSGLWNNGGSGEVTDSEAVAAYVAGDESAFDELYRRYKNKITARCWLILKDGALVQDAVSETFKTLAAKAHTFRQESEFKTWIFKVCTNCALMLLRAEKVADSRKTVFMQKPDEAPRSPLACYSDSELRALILQTLQKMAAEDRDVLILKDVQELTPAEISAITGLSIPCVKSRIHRARMELRRKLLRRGADDFLHVANA